MWLSGPFTAHALIIGSNWSAPHTFSNRNPPTSPAFFAERRDRAMTEVQLVVKHVRLDVTINLNVTLGPGEGAEAGSPEAAQARPTAAACVSSIAALASNDPDPTYVCRGREGGEFRCGNYSCVTPQA